MAVARMPFRRASRFEPLNDLIPRRISHEGIVMEQHVREGRFQRSLALVTAMSSLLSGLEVTYEHYRGSYNQQVMYTPVLLSAALAAVGIWSAFSRRIAHSLLPVLSALTVLDGVVGFYFHVRGVARKPGGWRIPAMNMIMGPPVFAPLLFSLSGYLGLLASLLRREDAPLHGRIMRIPHGGNALGGLLPRSIMRDGIVLEQHVREGRFQQQLAIAAGLAALFSGLEALYSHYKNNFTYRKLQWSPIVLTPLMVAAGIGTMRSRAVARTLLPAASILCLIDGSIGSFFHLRGVWRRPGGLKLPVYNTIYGPPIFAPLLFAASGFMGALASLLRRTE